MKVEIDDRLIKAYQQWAEKYGVDPEETPEEFARMFEDLLVDEITAFKQAVEEREEGGEK